MEPHLQTGTFRRRGDASAIDNEDWTCAPPLPPYCDGQIQCVRCAENAYSSVLGEAYRAHIAALWAAYYKGNTRMVVRFEGLLGGLCKGPDCPVQP